MVLPLDPHLPAPCAYLALYSRGGAVAQGVPPAGGGGSPAHFGVFSCSCTVGPAVYLFNYFQFSSGRLVSMYVCEMVNKTPRYL